MKVNWTTANIPDLTGKTIIVTEGTSSIGFEAVKAFSCKGAATVLACRDMKVGERAKKEILAQYPESKIEVIALDLSDLKSVNQFAEVFKSKFETLNVLLNNAGNVTVSFTKSKDGRSNTDMNHLAHFTLTGLLLERMAKTPNSRVVTISEGEHLLGAKDFGKLMSARGNGNSTKHVNGRSKWANMLFTYELQKHFDKEGINCIAVAAHPGFSNKNLERRLENKLSWRIFKPFFSMSSGPDAAIGALPGIRASVATDVKGGEYYGPDGFVEVKGYPSFSYLEQIVA